MSIFVKVFARRLFLGKDSLCFSICPGRITWTFMTRCYTVSNSQKYRNLERYFKRRLKAIYQKYEDMGLPVNTTVQGRDHMYFVEGKSIYRTDAKQGQPNPEEVLRLRVEEEAQGDLSLTRVRLSPGEKMLAALVKSSQREEATCVLVRLGDEEGPLDPAQPLLTLDKVFSFEWATDDVFLYSSQEHLRCHSVFRLELSATGPRTTLVYKEEEPDVFVEVSLSRDRKLLTINCSSRRSSEVWLLDVATPLMEPSLVQPRLPDFLYHVEHSRGQLVILANTAPGQEYQVLVAPLWSTSMNAWVPVCTPGPGWAVKDMEVVADHCVLATREPSGLLALMVVPLAQPAHTLTMQLPPWACAIETRRAGLEDSDALDFLLSSPVHPPELYRCVPREGLLLREGGEQGTPQDQPAYHTTRLEASSQDGAMVPVTLFHAVPLEGLTGAPLLVHVYGAYGHELNMAFSPERRLLLEQGWALAYCHVRGGGELGLGWARQGRVGGKQRAMEDLRAGIQLLLGLGVSSPSLSALTARSAGAVLAGALCNQHPHLLRAVTLQAPFLDVLATMQDPSLPLTMEERAEWGDPLNDSGAIASYCPSHNITPQYYPSMLVTAYIDDARVPVDGVRKYVERLRAAMHAHLSGHLSPEPQSVSRVVLDLQPGADHYGPEDPELALAESSRQLAFLYAELDLGHLTPQRRR